MFFRFHRANDFAEAMKFVLFDDQRIPFEERQYPFEQTFPGINAEGQYRMNAGFPVNVAGAEIFPKQFEYLAMLFMLVDLENRIDHPTQPLHRMANDGDGKGAFTIRESGQVIPKQCSFSPKEGKYFMELLHMQ